jgi:hypothetical protein
VKYLEYDWELFIDAATFHPFATTLPSLLNHENESKGDGEEEEENEEEQVSRWKIGGNSNSSDGGSGNLNKFSSGVLK